ncbi:Tetratricopeptide-like helical domain [Trinorchestia longiramus]|nr:Tetratricopeptide-like helical domain [Trinorchestia longiramus]
MYSINVYVDESLVQTFPGTNFHIGYCTLVGIGASRLYFPQRAPQDKKNDQTFEQGKRKGEKMKSGRLCTSGDREKDLTTTKEDGQKNEQSCSCLNSPCEFTTLKQCLEKQTPSCGRERSADRTLGACGGTLREAIKKSFQRLSVSKGEKEVLLDSSGYSSAHSSRTSSKNASPISSPYSSPLVIEGHPPFVCEELFAIDTKDSLEESRPQQTFLCRVSSPTSFGERPKCNTEISMPLILKEFELNQTYKTYFENNCLNKGYQNYQAQYSYLRAQRHVQGGLKHLKRLTNCKNLFSEHINVRMNDGNKLASCFSKKQVLLEMEIAKCISSENESSENQKVILDRQSRLCEVNFLEQKHQKGEKQFHLRHQDGGDRRNGKNGESNHRNVHINLSSSASSINVPPGKPKVSKRLRKFTKYPTLGSLFPIGRSSSLTSKNNFTRALGQICLIVTFFFLVNKCLLRNFDWSSRETLLRSGLAVLPNNAKFHYNYANLLREKELYEHAVHHYLRAIQLWPEYPSARNNLAAVLVLQGKLPEAEEQLRLVVQQYPVHQNAALNLAKLYKLMFALLIVNHTLMNRRKQWFSAARRVVSNALRIAEVYRDPAISEQMLQLLQSLEQSPENFVYEGEGKSIPERELENTAEHGLVNNDREVASLESCELAFEAAPFQEKCCSCADQTETLTFKKKKEKYGENILTPDDIQSFMKPEGVCCRYSRFRLSKFPSSDECET